MYIRETRIHFTNVFLLFQLDWIEMLFGMIRLIHCSLLFVMPRHSYRDMHDDVIEWKHFPRYWPFVRGIHRSPVNSPHKGQWRGALTFSLVCAWINAWVNSRALGDFRCHRTHYEVIIMFMYHISRNAIARYSVDCNPPYMPMTWWALEGVLFASILLHKYWPI